MSSFHRTTELRAATVGREVGNDIPPTYRIAGVEHSVSFSQETDAPEWDWFLAGTELGQFQQSGLWARIKAGEGWKVDRVCLSAGGSIRAGFQVLHRRTRFGRVGFLSKGPVLPQGSDGPEMRELLLRLVRDCASRHKLLALVAQPPDFDSICSTALSDGGFTDLGLSVVIEATDCVGVGPGRLDWRRHLRKSTQTQVKRAIKRGVTIRTGTEADLPLFFDLMVETCRRQGASPNPPSLEALRLLWSTFDVEGKIRMTFAECEGEVLSGILCLRFGNRMTAWKKGWNSKRTNLHPNALLTFESIEWAERSGCALYDHVGMDPAIARSVLEGRELTSEQCASRYYFLRGFGGTPQILPPPQIYFSHPLLRRLYPWILPVLQWRERLKRRRSGASRKPTEARTDPERTTQSVDEAA